MNLSIRRAVLGSSLAVLATLALGCSAPELADDRPAQTAVPESAPRPPAPPAQSYAVEPPPAPSGDSGLLGGPPEGDTGPAVIASTPIPNPEDLSPEERARIYGPDHHHRTARAWAGRPAAHRHHLSSSQHARHRARAHHNLSRHAGRSAAADHAPHHQAPVTHRAAGRATPHVLAPHAKAAPGPRAAPKAQSVHAAAPPVSSAIKSQAATSVAQQPKLDQLAAALSPDLATGAKLTIPAEVRAGKPGVVSLTLPVGLFDRLTGEAGKLSLAGGAQTADVRATLSGGGSTIVPNGVQTARLKSGEAASFNWQVTPAGPNPGLAADVGATLKGAGKPQTVPLGQVAASPVAGDDASKAASGPLTSFQDKQAGGPSQTGLLILLGVGLLVLVLVMAMVNRVRRDERLAERRRKARALEEAQAEEDAHHAPFTASEAERHTPETV